MFALTNSSVGLAEADVDLVWRVLVEGALTPEAAGEWPELLRSRTQTDHPQQATPWPVGGVSIVTTTVVE